MQAVNQRTLTNKVPVTAPFVGGNAYGQELINQKPAGTFQYGNGPSTYLKVAPGTKTKAKIQQELAEKQAAEKARQEQAAQSIANAVSSANNSSKNTSYLSGNTGGNLDSWLMEALKLTGQDASLLPYVRTIAMKESGGRPDAVNRWDSNWKKGTPSIGLMQTIQPTFNAYKLAGHDDIYNPVDNAIAAIRYAISRYGSLQNVPGIKAMAAGKGYVGY
jgi:hypothetical protein